jgi:hypothetical protein
LVFGQIKRRHARAQNTVSDSLSNLLDGSRPKAAISGQSGSVIGAACVRTMAANAPKRKLTRTIFNAVSAAIRALSET